MVKAVTPKSKANTKVSTKQSLSCPFDESLFDSSPEATKGTFRRSRLPMANISNRKTESKTRKKNAKPKKKKAEEEVAGLLLSFHVEVDEEKSPEMEDKGKRSKKKKYHDTGTAASMEKAQSVAVDKDEDEWPGCGKKYSNTGRLLLCKAWVRTSEDPIVGVGMTGTDFNKKLHANYVKLLTKQYVNHVLYSHMKGGITEDGKKKGEHGKPTLDEVNAVYPLRSSLNVSRYWQKYILYWISKWTGLWETLPEKSDTTFEDKYRITNQIFGRKHGRNFDDLKECWLYLQDLPKFAEFTMKHHMNPNSKKKRDIQQ